MDRANVIFILSDDQGIWALGCNNSEIRTPHLDRLAREGMVFDNFFCASPVCSPSRASFLTGRIPSQHGVHDYLSSSGIGPGAVRYMKGERAYTDVLAEHGYVCGLSGKWHLGASDIPQFGFTDWYTHQTGGGPYHNAPMVRGGKPVNEPGYVTERITDEALSMLDHYAAGTRPFYLGVHYTAPHSPWDGHPREIVDSYETCPFKSCPQEPVHPWAAALTKNNLGNRESLKGYFAAVSAMDQQIGRILDRVEQAGLREKTLVCFFSDNGFSAGHHGFWGKGNGTLPRNMYENSIKIPAIMSHPGRIPAGRRSAAMLSAYDFFPTLLEYAGLPAAADDGEKKAANRPGMSFAPVLLGQGDAPRESVVIFDEYGPVRMIRTREWKYVYRHAYGPHELYDLKNDPDERRNLYGDPAQTGRVEQMHRQMEQWFRQYADPRRDGLRVSGVAHGQSEPL